MTDFLEKLGRSLDSITVWGRKEYKTDQSLAELEKQLVDIYVLYFEGLKIPGSKEVVTSPDYDLISITQFVRSNLPELEVIPIVKIVDEQAQEVEWTNIDTSRSLARIIYELLVVQWHLENSEPGETLWQFIFSFENYIKQHISHLISYLTENHNLHDSGVKQAK